MKRDKRSFVLIVLLSLAVITSVLAALFWDDAVARLKARGILEYTPDEAQVLAFEKCSQCHPSDKVSKYCFRCGPPLIVVTHNMRTLTKLERARGRKNLDELTDAQAVAIAQVWNALVGNWEDTWRKKDIVKLLEGDEALLKLLDTPVEKRPIEVALSSKTAPGAYKEVQEPMTPRSPSHEHMNE